MVAWQGVAREGRVRQGVRPLVRCITKSNTSLIFFLPGASCSRRAFRRVSDAARSPLTRTSEALRCVYLSAPKACPGTGASILWGN